MATLLSYREAADRLGLSTRSLQRLVDAGRVMAYRLGPNGGRVRFAPEDLDRYVERCRKAGPR